MKLLCDLLRAQCAACRSGDHDEHEKEFMEEGGTVRVCKCLCRKLEREQPLDPRVIFKVYAR
jgi:hypothetical protein